MSIYLYVKTHSITGLKYLGMTTKQDPHTYPGSGIYWKKHLSKHGKHYSTEILAECSTKDEVKELGQYYSKLWNVVESKAWANLKEEAGDGGTMSDAGRKRIGEFHKRPLHEKYGKEKAEQIISNLRSKKVTAQTKAKMSAAKKDTRGSKHNRFKGYYITPWGKFGSAILAYEAAPFKLNESTVRDWCTKKQNTPLSKHTSSRFTYFDDTDIGKTFGQLGFGFELLV